MSSLEHGDVTKPRMDSDIVDKDGANIFMDPTTENNGPTRNKSNRTKLNTSPMKPSSSSQAIVKEGYLSRKTEHYHLLGSNSTAIGKTWKIYRVVLRGTKLYFFKPPHDVAELKSKFPASKSTGSDNSDKNRPPFTSISMPFSIASQQTSTGNSDSLQLVRDTESDRSLEIVPSMFDASTRLLLFSDNVVPSLTASGSINNVGGNDSSLSISQDNRLSSTMASKYVYGDVFLELDVSTVRFKQEIVILIFDDQVMVLTKKWVRITRSLENSGEPRKYSDYKSPQTLDTNIENAANFGKTMTKLTFDASYPFIGLQVMPIVTVVPLDPVIAKANYQTASSRPNEETIYCFELIMDDNDRRFCRASSLEAREIWIKRFHSCSKRYHKAHNIPYELKFRHNSTDEKPLTTEEIAKLWAGDFEENAKSKNTYKQNQAPEKRVRKFWGVGRHPEIQAKLSSDEKTEILIGGSMEGLIHEFVFRNLVGSSNQNGFYDSIGRALISMSSGAATGKFLLDELHRLYQLSVDKPDSLLLPVLHRILDLLKEFLEQADLSLKVHVEELLHLIKRKENLNEAIKIKVIFNLEFSKSSSSIFEGRKHLLVSHDNLLSDIELVNKTIPSGSFLKLEPLEIARQIFLYHVKMYCQVFNQGLISSMIHAWDSFGKESDFFQLNQSFCLFLPTYVFLSNFKAEKDEDMVSIYMQQQDSRLIRPLLYLNSFSQFILKQIISTSRSSAPRKRAGLISKWIRIGQILLEDFGDVYGWSCIADALLNTPIGRLADTWTFVDPSLIGMLTNQWLPIMSGSKIIEKDQISIPLVSSIFSNVSHHFRKVGGFPDEEEAIRRGYVPLERQIWLSQSFFDLGKLYSPSKISNWVNLIQPNSIIQEWLADVYEKDNSALSILNLSYGIILSELYDFTEFNENGVSGLLFRGIQTLQVSLFHDSLICEPPRHYPLNPQIGSSVGNIGGSDTVNITDLVAFINSFGVREQRSREEILSKKSAVESPVQSPTTSFKKNSSKKEAVSVSSNNTEDLISDNNLEFFITHDRLSVNETVHFVTAGTQERLLDFLVLGERYFDEIPKWRSNFDSENEDIFDDIFMKSFFATYRSFSTPATLLEGLKRRWINAEKLAHSNDVAVQLRIRVLKLVDYWINRYFVDFYDDMNAMDALLKFFGHISSKLVLSESFYKSIGYLVTSVLKKVKLPLVIPSEDDTTIINLMDIASNCSFEKASEITLDDQNIASVTKTIGFYALSVIKSVRMVDWVQVIDLFENSSSGFGVSFHSLTKQLHPNGNNAVEDSAIEISDVFSMLNLIYPPSNNISKCLLQSYNSSSASNWASNNASVIGSNFGLTNFGNSVSYPSPSMTQSNQNSNNSVAPFLTLLPSSVQRLYHFHQNLKLWSIHQILSANSPRNRVQRMKGLIELARQARRLYGRGNIIMRPILSALVSPESRIFARAWITLHEMPVDGIDSKTKKADKEKFECAESYVELLEILYEEIIDVLIPGKLMRQLMNDRADVPMELIPSLEDILDFFYENKIFSPDIYYPMKEQDGSIILNASSQSSHPPGSSNAASVRGISANTGLPLINFEKRLKFYALCSRISNLSVSGLPVEISDDLDFSFLLVPDFVASSQNFQTNFELACQAASKDSETKASIVISKGKLKFFTRLVEEEKELRKRREKEWKKLEILYEKKAGSSKGVVIKKEERTVPRPSFSGIGNSVQSPTSSMQVISNILKFRSRGSLGSISSTSTQGMQSPTLAPITPTNRAGSSVSVSNSAGSYTSNSKTQSQNDLSISTSYHSVPMLNNNYPPGSYPNVNAGLSETSNIETGRPVIDLVISTKSNTQDMQTPPTSPSIFKRIATSLSNDPRYHKPVKVVSLLQSRSHVATDYAKRNFVFRILTEDEQEVLLQAISRDDMLDWIKKLNESSIKKSDENSEDNDKTTFKGNEGKIAKKPSKLGNAMSNLINRRKANESSSTSGSNNNMVSTKPEEKPKTYKVDLVQQLQREIREKLQLEEKQGQQNANGGQGFWKRGKNAVVDMKSLNEIPSDLLWDENNSIPVIVSKCLHEVEERGMTEVGIYRLSGSSNLIKDIKKLFDADPFSVDLSAEEVPDINVVTGLLKLYFRELPEPLMTFELFDHFIQAADIPEYDERLIAIKDLVHMIPKPNFFLLKRLIEHLERVTDFEETNHMYATNLALLFGPTILRAPPEKWYQDGQRTGNTGQSEAKESIENETPESGENIASTMKFLGQCSVVVKNMILQYHWLFDVEREMDPIDNLAETTMDYPLPAARLSNQLKASSLIHINNDLGDMATETEDGQGFIEEVLDVTPPLATENSWRISSANAEGRRSRKASETIDNQVVGPEPIEDE